MKIKALSEEELERRIERLSSFKGTPHEHRSDKRYIKHYKNELEQQQRQQQD
jgi:hypothetical protein